MSKDDENSKEEDRWWSPKRGFFGAFYRCGDDSKEGYLIGKKQDLQERTVAEVNGVEELLSLGSKSFILDCPCGYGRHTIELAKRGYDVVGSDINPTHFLNAAIDSPLSKPGNVSLQLEDMRYINYVSRFDAVINMFYSFGFFETDEENMEVLKNFYRALKPGGNFLMHTDVNVPRIFAGNYKVDETRHLINGSSLRIIDNYDCATKRMEGSWIIHDGTGGQEKREYSVRVYTKEEFFTLCYDVGFSSCVAYSNWDGDSYTEEAEDMIIVATK